MTASRTRAVAVLVVVMAFIALAVFALLARAYRPGRDGVRVQGGSLGLTTPHLAQPVAATRPGAKPVVAAVTQDAPTKPAPSAAPTAPPPSDNGAVPLAACELGLPVPAEQAGLANLVMLVPLFGPFSPETFAMVPAFDPAFPLFAPLIIFGGQQLDAHPDALNSAIAAVHPVEEAGYEAVNPFYGPYRQQVLAAESQGAKTLEPEVETFAAAPGATCLPAALALIF